MQDEARELTIRLGDQIGLVADRLRRLFGATVACALLLFVIVVEMAIRIAQG